MATQECREYQVGGLRAAANPNRVCHLFYWQGHAYCLMGNPFHLVLEKKRANLMAGISWFLGTYTARFNHGQELKESDAQKAERLLKEKLRKLGWTDKELKVRRKGDRQKARLAAQLRKETTMTWAWITTRLAMGHCRTAANAARAHSAK